MVLIVFESLKFIMMVGGIKIYEVFNEINIFFMLVLSGRCIGVN